MRHTSQPMDHIKILDTTDITCRFEAAVGCRLSDADCLEFYHQLFQLLDQHTPMDLTDRRVLDYSRFVFTNHLKINEVELDRVAYGILIPLWQHITLQGFYVNGSLMYFPISMQYTDLCLRRYNS